MPHWRKCFNNEYIGVWDLEDKPDPVVTIESVEGVKLKGQTGKEESKALISLVGIAKPFIANKTNCKTIARLYGNDTAGWVGKDIQLFVKDVEAFGETTQGVYVKPIVPPAKLRAAK